MDFNIRNYAVVNIFGLELWITESMVNTWIIMGALILLAVVVRVKLRKFQSVPSGFQNVIEAIVDTFDGFLRDSAGEKLAFLGNWFFTVFAFLLVSNTSGLFRLRPPSADWTVTFALAFVTFVLIQVMGVKYRKGAYLKSLIEPSPVFLPLNIIGELARPVSLSFRLFGNMLAGLILLSLIYAMAPVFLTFLLPSALHFYFDLFSGALQAFIFCVLSLSFIGISAEVEST